LFSEKHVNVKYKGETMMRTTFRMTVIVSAAILLSFVCGKIAEAKGQETLKLNYLDFAPFSWKDAEGHMKGIFIDVHNEALNRRMGVSVTHAEYPWKRAQIMVKRGEADGFTTVPTSERREYTEISKESVIISDVVLFASVKNPKMEDFKKVKTISDLKGFRLVDYLGNGWAKKNLDGLDVTWEYGISETLILLASGKGDMFVQSGHVTDYNIKKLGLQNQIVEIHNVLESVSFNLCIGKKSAYANILPEFDKTIQEMRKDGTLQKIYDMYR
jgi:polar amino acid transport system substrate-binding protein